MKTLILAAIAALTLGIGASTMAMAAGATADMYPPAQNNGQG